MIPCLRCVPFRCLEGVVKVSAGRSEAKGGEARRVAQSEKVLVSAGWIRHPSKCGSRHACLRCTRASNCHTICPSTTTLQHQPAPPKRVCSTRHDLDTAPLQGYDDAACRFHDTRSTMALRTRMRCWTSRIGPSAARHDRTRLLVVRAHPRRPRLFERDLHRSRHQAQRLKRGLRVWTLTTCYDPRHRPTRTPQGNPPRAGHTRRRALWRACRHSSS